MLFSIGVSLVYGSQVSLQVSFSPYIYKIGRLLSNRTDKSVMFSTDIYRFLLIPADPADKIWFSLSQAGFR